MDEAIQSLALEAGTLETPRSPSHLTRCLTLENYRKIA